MACEEHLKLASYVKMVHQELRQQSKEMGFETAWELHCSQEEKLNQYASSMLNLATHHWEGNLQSTEDATECRIQWIYQQCVDYFLCQGLLKWKRVEKRKFCAYITDSQPKVEDQVLETASNVSKPLYMLDVGSCYNPFKKYDIFDVLAIDIAPGCLEVKKCDFLKVKLESDIEISPSNQVVLSLKRKYFQVIVFSLLLEYFPNPQLRFQCCSKAYELLQTDGLLFIITPDSKHATANAPIMKKWRVALAMLGFWRVSYEKLKHLHCMAFVKSRFPEFPKTWAEKEINKCGYKETAAELIVIPQDFNSLENESSDEAPIPTDRNPENIVDLFGELPSME